MIPLGMLAAASRHAAVDPSFASVVSLLHFNGANGSTVFTDQKGKIWTPSGGAQITTAFSVFGGSSGSFDGGGDYIQTPNHADFQFGTGDFTIEFWLRTPDASGNILSMVNAAAGNWALVLAAGTVYWQTAYATTNLFSTADATIRDNTARHVVVQRASGVTTLGWSGVSKVSAADATNYIGTGAVRLCSGANGDLLANVDDLRITKGVARYAFPYTQPTSPFPDT